MMKTGQQHLCHLETKLKRIMAIEQKMAELFLPPILSVWQALRAVFIELQPSCMAFSNKGDVSRET